MIYFIIVSLPLMIYFLNGCSFKPGTLSRVESIAAKDELKLIKDEAQELEEDLVIPDNDGIEHTINTP